jgi:hypothetical protein
MHYANGSSADGVPPASHAGTLPFTAQNRITKLACCAPAKSRVLPLPDERDCTMNAAACCLRSRISDAGALYPAHPLLTTRPISTLAGTRGILLHTNQDPRRLQAPAILKSNSNQIKAFEQLHSTSHRLHFSRARADQLVALALFGSKAYLVLAWGSHGLTPTILSIKHEINEIQRGEMSVFSMSRGPVAFAGSPGSGPGTTPHRWEGLGVRYRNISTVSAASACTPRTGLGPGQGRG